MANIFSKLLRGAGKGLLNWAGDATETAIGFATAQAIQAPMLALQQRLNSMFPLQLLGGSDIVTAYMRGFIDKERVIEELRKQGINSERAEIILKNADSLLGVGDIQQLYNRKDITETQAIERLGALGFSADSCREVLKLAGYIPSAADFIRFAVRDVFTPEIAEKYGQYEDYPADFENMAQLSGLSPAYAKYYWAAHWDLPSISQGFEMMQRGIIDVDDMKLLLKSLDVMPYWRDKYIQMSYVPFTRVDVRRMFKTGVLTEEEVFESYKAIGYDDYKAQKMTEYTVNDAMEGTKDLSKSEIINAYEDGLLTRAEAVETIRLMGFSENEAEILVQMNDLKRSRAYTKTFISALKREYLNYRLSENDVKIYLNKLNIKPEAIEEALDAWTLELQPNIKKPTKAEILKWWKEDLMTEELARAELAALGYTQKYIDLYLYSPPDADLGVD